MSSLKRKQIYLDRASDNKIRQMAKATGLSEAEHIRRAVSSYVSGMPDGKRGRSPLRAMIGLCDDGAGPKDAAVHHDKYLYKQQR
jgi:hypothetical protein